MKHATVLDELNHWLGQLTVDLGLGVERRHLLSTARLCELLVDRASKEPEAVNRYEFTRLSLRMLDLNRRINGGPAQSRPSLARARPPRLRIVQ